MKVHDTDKPNFLAKALERIITYTTPESVLNYVKKQRVNIIIGNPPYDTRTN